MSENENVKLLLLEGWCEDKKNYKLGNFLMKFLFCLCLMVHSSLAATTAAAETTRDIKGNGKHFLVVEEKVNTHTHFSRGLTMPLHCIVLRVFCLSFKIYSFSCHFTKLALTPPPPPYIICERYTHDDVQCLL